jgi:ribosomal protein S18 acetylase RimI-like enzyme
VHTEFRLAEVPREVRALVAFDHKVFRPADWYSPAQWRAYESYWMLVDGRKAGCCSFERDHDFRDDLGEADPPCAGSLHITSTGVLPRYQGHGLGTLMKAWQVAFARRNGFMRMVTAARKSNSRMIALNKKFGFRVLRTTPSYYRDPVEPVVVMELRLG